MTLMPAHTTTLIRWYLTEALLAVEGPSISGGIEEQLSMYSLHQAQAFADDHPEYYPADDEGRSYSVHPRGPITARVTAEYRNTKDHAPQFGMTWREAENFRTVSRALMAVKLRDPRAHEVLCEYAVYGDPWGDPMVPLARMRCLYWMTRTGAEIAKLVDADAKKNGWPEMANARAKLASRERAGAYIKRREEALRGQATEMLAHAYAAWCAAVNETAGRETESA